MSDEAAAELKELRDEVEQARGRMQGVDEQLEVAKKEAAKKVSDSKQYQQLRKMLATKNKQLRELRERLRKYNNTRARRLTVSGRAVLTHLRPAPSTGTNRTTQSRWDLIATNWSTTGSGAARGRQHRGLERRGGERDARRRAWRPMRGRMQWQPLLCCGPRDDAAARTQGTVGSDASLQHRPRLSPSAPASHGLLASGLARGSWSELPL